MTNIKDRFDSKQLAVLITCHNRCDTTLACLKALYQQGLTIDVFLVDDGSSDGTTKAINNHYPDVNVMKGNGNLYWAGGMRLAFSEAMKHNYSYYLWLNDDTLLEPQALDDLLDIYQDLAKSGHANSIVVGSTKDADTGKPTYGGAVQSKLWYTKKFEFVEPGQTSQKCDTFFGNCVLIPNLVAAKVGNIDDVFIHTMGDIDYGLRARKLGCSVWAAPGFVGTCSRNSISGSWADTNLSLYKRLRKVFGLKGFPFVAWTVFCRRHSGSFWFIYWFMPYLRSVIGYKDLSKSPSFSKRVKLD
ncbi:MAG: glycosyltransferase family 2 protein [Cyanobacteria bacterium P01_A01_bin.84]